MHTVKQVFVIVKRWTVSYNIWFYSRVGRVYLSHRAVKFLSYDSCQGFSASFHTKVTRRFDLHMKSAAVSVMEGQLYEKAGKSTQ